MTWMLLGLGLIATRWLPHTPEAGWHRTRDPLLILALGLGATALLHWVAPFHMPRGSMTASDFPEYCGCLLALNEGQADLWSTNRSVFAAWPAAFFARHLGVLDGFLAASLGSAAWTVAAVALWARALHSRLAAVLTALLYVALSPLVVSSRMINLVPEMGAFFATGAALTAVALRWPRPALLLLGGAGAGLTLLAELRGIIWALPLYGLLGLAAFRGERRRIPLRMGCVLLPLFGSWLAGPVAYPLGTTPLEHHVNLQFHYTEMGLTDSKYQPPWDVATSHYVWGRSRVRDIPATLLHMRSQRQYVPSYDEIAHLEDAAGGAIIRHWLPVLPFAGLLALWGLRRRPWLVLGLVGTVLPFLVALQGSIMAFRAVHRFLVNPMLFAPVLLGIAGATLASSAPRAGPRGWMRGLAGAALVGATVVGILPSSLSPQAAWRIHLERPDGSRDLQWYMAKARGKAVPQPGPKALPKACAKALREDVGRGRPRWVATEFEHLGSWSASQPNAAPMGSTPK
jgi:hypothetical protein